MPRKIDDLAIERWPTDRPKPFKKNPRQISQAAVDKVARSIEAFGFRQPIVVNKDGVVIIGHARLLAAQKLGLEEVPVHIAKGLSVEKQKALRIADNRTHEEAEWDIDLLAGGIRDLMASDFDIDLLGFDSPELDRLLRDDAGDDLDEAIPLPDKPITRLGDLWQCGPHRLLCGDATSADDVGRLLAGDRPHLMVTDPPYGVNYDPKWRQLGWTGARATGEVKNDDRADWRDAWALFPGDVIYAWHPPGPDLIGHGMALVESGFAIRMQIIWAKQHFVIGRGQYHVQHEPCWYAVRKGAKAHWQGSRKESTLWEIANRSAFGGEQDDADTQHSTQKPVECMRRPIRNNSARGDLVYDPFLGSGTTMIAAQDIERVCLGIDIDPIYCDVAVRRWQATTEEQATLDGKPFDKIAEERNAA